MSYLAESRRWVDELRSPGMHKSLIQGNVLLIGSIAGQYLLDNLKGCVFIDLLTVKQEDLLTDSQGNKGIPFCACFLSEPDIKQNNPFSDSGSIADKLDQMLAEYNPDSEVVILIVSPSLSDSWEYHLYRIGLNDSPVTYYQFAKEPDIPQPASLKNKDELLGRLREIEQRLNRKYN